jgi:hypothetical protein
MGDVDGQYVAQLFKYMRAEFLLDALVDYRIEPEDPTRTIPNPERRALDKQIRTVRVELAKIEREYGAAAADNTEQHRPTMRGFKIAYGKLGQQLRAARDRVATLIDQRRNVPQRVEIQDLNERAVVKLATERKHLTDIIKMVGYQAESDLLALLRPHYARAEQEGRTLLHELFAAAGDIRVCNSELHITLAPRPIAAPLPRPPPPPPELHGNRTFSRCPMSGGLNLCHTSNLATRSDRARTRNLTFLTMVAISTIVGLSLPALVQAAEKRGR